MADNFLDGVLSEPMRNVLSNMAFGTAGLAEGTNSATIQTANALAYTIDNITYLKAATNNVAMTACAAQADLTTCNYLVSINSSGTIKLTKGADVLTTAYDAATYRLPDCPENEVAIGVMKIVTSGGTFTSGTTDLSAAAVTDIFTNLCRWQRFAPV